MLSRQFRARLIATAAGALLMLPLDQAWAQQAAQPKAPPEPNSAAHEMADVFSQISGRIYEDCIFELSEEQMDVQQALIQAYVRLGADHMLARQLAVKQIRPPRLSTKCEKIKSSNPGVLAPASLPAPGGWAPSVATPDLPSKKRDSALKLPAEPTGPAPLSDKKILPSWDCAPGVDYVTIMHKGYERKLSNGEICSPFDDVVRAVPDSATSFKLGYTIRTGRLFVISDDAAINGRTVAWAISGRDVCRNNPDPDCLAARAIGPLPPGEYNFASKKEHRVSWGPKTRRMVSGIWLSKLWYKEKYSAAQTKAIMARGNIAIHVRLRGEMSEACLGLGEKGWAYVAQLIKEGRATGVNVYIDEPHPQVAETPPIIRHSNFSLSALFKQ